MTVTLKEQYSSSGFLIIDTWDYYNSRSLPVFWAHNGARNEVRELPPNVITCTFGAFHSSAKTYIPAKVYAANPIEAYICMLDLGFEIQHAIFEWQ